MGLIKFLLLYFAIFQVTFPGDIFRRFSLSYTPRVEVTKVVIARMTEKEPVEIC